MYFYTRMWGGSERVAPDRAAQSLGLFAGHPADSCRDGADFFSELPTPRAPKRPGWRVGRSPGGAAVLLLGWIDNLAELSADLGIGGSPETIYGAAVERWGRDADRRIIGQYAALIAPPDGNIRLSRSPWFGFPLYFHLAPDHFMACSIPRPMFAAGLPKKLRRTALERLIAFEYTDDEQGVFEGIDQVPGGSIVTVTRDGWTTDAWYDPLDIPEVRFKRDEDYVEAANEVLATAAHKALAMARKPATTLSGGLDSSMACDELLRQLPAGQRLTSITFVPLQEWSGRTVNSLFGDDGPYVREFIKQHDRLDPIFVDNRDVDYLSHSDELFLAGDAGPTSQVIGLVHTGVWRAARDAGCDWLFSAGAGNMTYSNEAPWAAAEYFRTLRWGQLWHIAANRTADPRPMWRRLVAMGIMPNVPTRLRWAIRDLVHRGRVAEPVANPYLDPAGALAAKLQSRNLVRSTSERDYFHSRERLIRSTYDIWWRGTDSTLAYWQVFGIRGRDIPSYRPLIELCLGMPTDQYARDGQRRRLARRMAVGRLPEAQRTELRHGDHVVDWHERLTPMLPFLREEVRRIAEHPELSELLDTQAMLRDIDNWPDIAPTDILSVTRLRFALPAMSYARRYIDYVSGRNPQ